jgi:hypothetical protein
MDAPRTTKADQMRKAKVQADLEAKEKAEAIAHQDPSFTPSKFTAGHTPAKAAEGKTGGKPKPKAANAQKGGGCIIS